MDAVAGSRESSRAGSGPALPGAVAGASALAVALATGLAIVGLHRYAGASFREAALFARLDALVHHLRYLDGEVQRAPGAGGQPDAGEGTRRAAELDRVRTDLAAVLGELERIDAVPAAAVAAAAERYLAAVAEHARLVAAGQAAAAAAWRADRVAPAFAALDVLIEGGEIATEATARRTELLVDAGTITALVLAALAAGLLFRRAVRAVAVTALLEGEQRGLRASERRVRALLDASPDLVFRFRRDGTCLDLHATDPATLPAPPPAIVGRAVGEVFPPEIAGLLQERIAAALATGTVQSADYRLALPGGPRDFDARLAPNGPDEVLCVARDVTERTRAEQGQRFLAAAGEALAASLDYDATLAAVARLVVPHLADACLVHVVEPDGTVRRAGEAHRDAAHAELLAELRHRPIDPAGEHPLMRVVRSGRAAVVPTVDAAALLAVADDPGRLDLVQRLHLTSFICVPLVAAGRVLGALSFLGTDPGRRYGAADLRLAEEVARRAALAIENARLHREAVMAEARYRTLVEQVPAVVYVEALDRDPDDWTVPYVSPQIEALLGYTPEEWTGGGFDFWETIIHPDDHERVAAEDQRTERTGEPFHAEYRMTHRDGHAVWVRDEAALVRDEAGAPLFWQGIMLDVTAQKEADAALREAEERYRTLVEQIPAVTYIEELDGAQQKTATRYISPQIEALLGYTPDEWLADDRFWERVVHPADRAGVLAEDARTEATGEPFRAEYREIARDGHTVWVRDEAVLVRDADGRPLYWQGVVFDVTAQKEAEAALRAHAARLAAIVAVQTEVIACERDAGAVMRLVAERVLALTAADAAVVEEIRDGELATWAAAGLTAEQAGERPRLAESFSGFCLRTGEVLRCDDAERDDRVDQESCRRAGIRSVLAAPLFLRGQAVGVLKVLARRPAAFGDEDAQTLRVMAGLVGAALASAAAFDAERAARAAAEEASRLKSQFLSTMSHELRTPLNAIMGYAHLLLDGFDGRLAREQEADVRLIAAGADRLLALVDDVLDLSRIEAGRLDLDFAPVDPARVVADVCAEVGPQTAAKGLQLAVEAPSALSLVRADRRRLHQALLNLVGNAVKFTEEGRVAVATRAAGAGVEIVVADTGIGIPPDVLPFVFDEFRQADGSTTRRYGGSGLGLAIAKRLVEAQGGTIAADSTPGVGSTFTVWLPMAVGPSP